MWSIILGFQLSICVDFFCLFRNAFYKPQNCKTKGHKTSAFREIKCPFIQIPVNRCASQASLKHRNISRWGGLGALNQVMDFFEDCGRNKTIFCVKLFQLRNPSHWVGYFALSGENFNKVTILSYAWSATLFWKDEWAKTTLINLYTCLASVFFCLATIGKGNKKTLQTQFRFFGMWDLCVPLHK